MFKKTLVLLIAATISLPSLACDLKVDAAWIRAAPGNATALAGYAVLSNAGSKALTVVALQSAAFAQVDMHETLTENGMASMRAIDKLEIAPGGKVEFAPGGKHFMMINPKAGLRSGDVVTVKIKDAAGCETTASFKVSNDAANATDAMDHTKMDHSKMDHSSMHPE